MYQLMIILFIILMKKSITQEYIPLEYYTSKKFILTNPCSIKNSIRIENKFLYKFNQRICISKKIFPNQNPIVNSIAYLNNDLLLIINGNLFRTENFINSKINNDIIYRLINYSNIPKIDYVFTTPCCICLNSIFNDCIILANKQGDVILFYFKSMTVIYNFQNIFQLQSVCQSNPCKILYLGLIHSHPILICVIQYQIEKAIIFHMESNSSIEKPIFLNFTGEFLHITPSSIPNSYFLWDKNSIYYTLNGGKILSKIQLNGCKIDYLNNMNKYQLEIYYKNLDINYDDLILKTKEIYCLNFTIDYIIISNKEFFILTDKDQWLYGKETLSPSVIYLKDECYVNQLIPEINSQCLINQSIPCSDFVQSYCLYTRFQPLFDINQIYILEKNKEISLKFILECYTIIPIMITSTKSNILNYSINYTINRLDNGIIQIIGNILLSTINRKEILMNFNDDLFSSSLISIRLDLVQYSYLCKDPSSFSFQIEISCSPTSTLRVEEDNHFNYWHHSNTIDDIKWLNLLHQFSPVYIKHKPTDPILLKYQYCFNNSCEYLNNTIFIIYAIPLKKNHIDYAHYLINRTDSCIPLSRLIYHLWIKSTLNKTEFFQIPYERRTFYQTLLNILLISNKSCLFFNESNPIYINETINQASEDYLKFILHIIAYNIQYSFCDLETFLLIEIETIHNHENIYHGWIFFIIFFLFIFLIYLYTYYKNYQRKKYLEYYRLNQIDAGQLHQWYDIAQDLKSNNYLRVYLMKYYAEK